MVKLAHAAVPPGAGQDGDLDAVAARRRLRSLDPLAAVAFDQLGLAFDWSVNRVIAEIQKERLVFYLVDNPDRLVREPVGQVFALAAEFEMGHVAELAAVMAHQPLEPAQHQRDVAAEDAAVGVHLVHHHVADMRFVRADEVAQGGGFRQGQQFVPPHSIDQDGMAALHLI